MKTISDHPLLIGELLRRAAERQERRRRLRSWLRRLFGLNEVTRHARISDTEIIYSPDR